MSRRIHNYYERLGVLPSANMVAIKRAYRSQARRFHPDLNPEDPEAEQRFKELQQAYEVLKDPQRRTRYDHSLGLKTAHWTDYAEPSEARGDPAQPASTEPPLGPQSEAARAAAEQIRQHIHRAWKEGFGTRTYRVKREPDAEPVGQEMPGNEATAKESTAKESTVKESTVKESTAKESTARDQTGNQAAASESAGSKGSSSDPAGRAGAGAAQGSPDDPRAARQSARGHARAGAGADRNSRTASEADAPGPELAGRSERAEREARTGRTDAAGPAKGHPEDAPGQAEPKPRPEEPVPGAPGTRPSSAAQSSRRSRLLEALGLLLQWGVFAGLMGLSLAALLVDPALASFGAVMAFGWLIAWSVLSVKRRVTAFEGRLRDLERQVRALKTTLDDGWFDR